MPDWLYDLLFSFKGRIDRRQWWLGFAIICAGSAAGFLVLSSGAHIEAAGAVSGHTANMGEMLWDLAWVYPTTAITVKRLADRRWPVWLGYALGGLCVVFALMNGILDLPALISAGGSPDALIAAAGLFSFAILVDNAFLPSKPATGAA